jgi:hypothetical protein
MLSAYNSAAKRERSSVDERLASREGASKEAEL